MCTPDNQTRVVEEQIQQLQSAALARIEEAKDRDALEQVRVDVLGRKGSLAQFNVWASCRPRSEKCRQGAQRRKTSTGKRV